MYKMGGRINGTLRYIVKKESTLDTRIFTHKKKEADENDQIHLGQSTSATNVSNLFLNQRTPLHIAVREGQEYTVKSLVDKGADISIKDNDGVSETGSRLLVQLYRFD